MRISAAVDSYRYNPLPSLSKLLTTSPYHEAVTITAMSMSSSSWKKSSSSSSSSSSPTAWRRNASLLHVIFTIFLYSTFAITLTEARSHYGVHLRLNKRQDDARETIGELGPQRFGPTFVEPDDSIKPKVIWVGKQGDLFKQVFTPQTLFQRVGGNVTFHFFPNNHSVVSSSFEKPCQPKDTHLPNSFFSDFFPVKVGAKTVPTFTITIQTEEPIYFFCAQGQHCQNGMVGIINPREDQPISSFVSAAARAPFALAPGNTPPSTIEPISPSAAADPAVTAFSPPLQSTSAAAVAKVQDGVIVGIVLGGIALLALIGVGVGFFVARKRRESRKPQDEGAMYENGRQQQQQQDERVYADESRARQIGKWMIGRPRRQTAMTAGGIPNDGVPAGMSRDGSNGNGGSTTRIYGSGSGGVGSSRPYGSRGRSRGASGYREPQMGEAPQRPDPIRIQQYRRTREGSDTSEVSVRLAGGYRI